MQEDGSLRVRGYVFHPLIGQTQLWSRVSSSPGTTRSSRNRNRTSQLMSVLA